MPTWSRFSLKLYITPETQGEELYWGMVRYFLQMAFLKKNVDQS
jgi:hypothetical protein